MIVLRFFVFSLLLVASTSRGSAQVVSRDPGVSIIVGPMDEFNRSWGLRAEDIRDVAQASVRSQGWRIDESSSLLLTVHVRSLAQCEEDKFLFQIEVHGGSSALELKTGQDTYAHIGDIPGVKTIEVPWNDTEAVLAGTKQLVRDVSSKLRKSVLRKERRN